MWGLVLERRAASVKALSAQQVYVTAGIAFAAFFGTIIVGALDLLFLPAVIGWLIAMIVVWRRGIRVGVDGWYHRATILTAFVAAGVSAEISKIWLYGGCDGRWDCVDVATSLNYIGFHHLLDFGIGVSCILLVLWLAWIPAIAWAPSSTAPFSWQPVHWSQLWFLAAVLAATLPAATIAGWAAYLAISHQNEDR
jgi:hypothetical protein